MRILVTGGAGFIGSHLVDKLLEGGHEVSVVDDMSSGTIHNLEDSLRNQRLHLSRRDFTEPRFLRSELPGTDVVVHLAALTSVPDSILHPENTYRVNAEGTAALLQACEKHSVRRFILASSAAVYGGRAPPLTEAMPPDPLSPYAASKVFAEVSVRSWTASSGLESVILRFMNVYGTRCSATNEGVIPSFLRALKKGEPLIVFGRGNQTRDFVHVSDVINSITLALRTSACKAEVFNVGAGHRTTITDLVSIFRELLPDKKIRAKHLPARKGDVRQSFADMNKAARVLKFTPRVMLKDGLADLLKKEALD